MDASSSLARAAALSIEENCGDGESLEAVAARFGCTARHLRRVFEAEYRVSPVRWRLTCRLLLAKNLLAETALPVVDIAAASGFGSLRRFNDAFKKYYKMSPSEMRRSAAMKRSNDGAVTVSLGYRPPYLWDEILRFFAARAIPGVETVRGGAYMRAVRFAGGGADAADVCGWFAVSHNPAKNALDVTLCETLLPVLPRLLSRVRAMFDLYCEPSEIYAELSPMNEIKPGLCRLGTRVPGCFDAFEMAARSPRPANYGQGRLCARRQNSRGFRRACRNRRRRADAHFSAPRGYTFARRRRGTPSRRTWRNLRTRRGDADYCRKARKA